MTKNGVPCLKIPAGSGSFGLVSMSAQIRERCSPVGKYSALKSGWLLRCLNLETPASWKRIGLVAVCCNIVGSLSARRCIRSKSKKTDFPNQILDSAGNGERRERTNPRLPVYRKQINTEFGDRQSRSLSLFVLGPHQDLSTL